MVTVNTWSINSDVLNEAVDSQDEVKGVLGVLGC